MSRAQRNAKRQVFTTCRFVMRRNGSPTWIRTTNPLSGWYEPVGSPITPRVIGLFAALRSITTGYPLSPSRRRPLTSRLPPASPVKGGRDGRERPAKRTLDRGGIVLAQVRGQRRDGANPHARTLELSIARKGFHMKLISSRWQTLYRTRPGEWTRDMLTPCPPQVNEVVLILLDGSG